MNLPKIPDSWPAGVKAEALAAARQQNEKIYWLWYTQPTPQAECKDDGEHD